MAGIPHYKKKPEYIKREGKILVPVAKITANKLADKLSKFKSEKKMVRTVTIGPSKTTWIYAEHVGVTPIDLERLKLKNMGEYYGLIQKSSNKSLIQNLDADQATDFLRYGYGTISDLLPFFKIIKIVNS